jgi:hypothetical protein
MDSVATEVALRATFGVAARAFAGASLSFLDTVSDFYIIYQYWEGGRTFYAWLLIGMISANLFLQLCAVLMNTLGLKRGRVRNTLFGMLTVVTFTKPGFDAWDLASGAEQLEGAALTPLNSYTLVKAVEMFCEAIPGFTLQAVALITSKTTSKAAVFSLLVSAGSAGLCSAAITFDFDTDMAERRASPHLYGMIPNVGRGLAYANLMAMATMQIVAKGVAAALLIVTNPLWLWYYLACDYGLYFLYKAVMGDLWVFLPLPPAVSVLAAVLYRVITKAIADFSGCVLLRLPDELGGAYFAFNAVSAQASILLSVYLYNEYFEAEEGEKKWDATMLWIFAIASIVSCVLLFAFFLSVVCDPKHRHSFYGLRTGWRHSCGYFLDFEDDEHKIKVFDINIMQWAGIADEVMAWTMANWEGWERDKPEWFTPFVKSTVPDDFIPPRFLAEMGGARERRGSAAGSVKEVLAV